MSETLTLVDPHPPAWPEEPDLPEQPLDTIWALREQRRTVRLAQARELELAAHYAEQCRTINDRGFVLPGMETLAELGAEGTPKIAEFAGLELAVGLGISDDQAYALMGSALSIKYRMPSLWRLVMSGHLDVWLAGKLDHALRELDLLSAVLVSDELATHIGSLGPSRLIKLAQALALATLEPTAAEQKRRDALEDRGVWFEQSDGGVTRMEAKINPSDAIFIDAQLNRFARILKKGGSTQTYNARRCVALGLLASPARALQLIQADLFDDIPALVDDHGLEPTCPALGQRGHSCGAVTVAPEKLLPNTQLYVHLSDETLRSGDGLIRAEQMKPLLASWLKDLIGDTLVRVNPVIDIAGMAPADSYEIPDRMREAVTLRNPYSVFPWSRRASRGCQLDHTIAFNHAKDRSGNPLVPGQTTPPNLGPLSCRQHRGKTHTDHNPIQIHPGVFLWTTPLGQRCLVTPSGTWRLTSDPPPPRHDQAPPPSSLTTNPTT